MDLDVPFFPEQASSIAGQLDLFIFSLVGISVFFATIVAALIVYFGVKYRWGAQDVDRSDPLEENTKLEIGWSLLPLIISLIVFVWSAQVFFEMNTPPQDTLNISVIGQQWVWKVQHPDGRREVNELHVPIDQPIKLTMTSQDVIHSFFIPAFRVKQDVLPGRFTTLWFEPIKTGEYHLFCAEYCGTEHAVMGGRVVVMEAAEYEEWLREGNQILAQAGGQGGEALFQQQGCTTCHQADGLGGLGPSLVGVYNSEVKLEDGEVVTADEEYLRESIVEPQAKIVDGYPRLMPTYQGQLSEEQLLMLVDYIKSMNEAESTVVSPEQE